jgi:hypothetical protein
VVRDQRIPTSRERFVTAFCGRRRDAHSARDRHRE